METLFAACRRDSGTTSNAHKILPRILKQSSLLLLPSHMNSRATFSEQVISPALLHKFGVFFKSLILGTLLRDDCVGVLTWEKMVSMSMASVAMLLVGFLQRL